MTDNNTESGQQPGDVGQPAQPPSGSPGTPPSSVDLKALAEALRPLLAEDIQRGAQSTKDKRIAKLQGQQDELLARYDDLLKEMTPAKAKRELLIDQLLVNQLEQQSAPVPTGSAGTTSQAASDPIAALIPNLGLEPNSSEVVAAIRAHSNDLPAQLAALNDLAAKKKAAQAQPPQPGSIMSSAGGATAASGDDAESLTAKLNELMKNPAQNVEKIQEVSAKLKPLLPKK